MTERNEDAPDGSPDTTEPAPEPPTPDAESTATEPQPAAPEPEPATELAADIDAASGDEALEVDDESATEVPAGGATGAAGAAAASSSTPWQEPARVGGRRGATQAPIASSIPEPAIRIRDRASSLFVIVTLVVFGLIALNGLLLGTGGALHPYVPPTEAPSPSESVSPSPSGSAAPSGSASASGSAAPSGSLAPSGSVAPSPSVAPSVSPPPS
jgi:hypothetical protein